MVMSCSREWTSVAARPCWGWWCHANPSPTHMHTRFHCFSVPWSYKTACIHVLLGAVTLTCSLSRCSSVLLYVCSICTATRKWLSAAKIINSLEFKCLLSLSLGSLTGIILPCFCLAWRFQLWRLLMPVILSLCFFCFSWINVLKNVTFVFSLWFHCVIFLILVCVIILVVSPLMTTVITCYICPSIPMPNSVVEVLEKHGLQKPISYVKNSQNNDEEAHQLMVKLCRHTGRKYELWKVHMYE